MKTIQSFIKRKPKLGSALLWLLAGVITIACFTYQDKTGPTYPLEGELETAQGDVQFKILRSETIGTDLKIMLLDPVPEGVNGYVEYRRYKSNDEWSTVEMEPGSFSFSRRGQEEFIEGVGTELPSLAERAGKYEFFVFIDDGVGDHVSITGEKPIYSRYKADVPMWALFVHIVLIFASMTLAIRTTFEALVDGNFKPLIWATIISLILGAFILGPLVQWYAFGVWWSGIPFGYDWTDNKVLLELVFWLFAAFQNRGKNVNRRSVYLAGLITLIVYFIPHSIFGSEYNYQTGEGHGTAS
jgi:hypothetical protein